MGDRLPVTIGPTRVVNAHAPVVVGVAVFLVGVGSGVQLGPFAFYVRSLVLPGVVAAAWVVGRGARPFDQIKISAALAVMLVWMVMAAAWSPAELQVVVESLLLVVMITLTAHLGGAVFAGHRLLQLQAGCVAVVMAIVALHAIVDPAAAFSLYEGEAGFGGSVGLRSIFFHKNSLGILLTSGVALAPAILHRGRRAAYGAALVLLLALCNSSTAWVASACIVVSWFFVRQAATARRSGSRGGVFLLVGVALITVATAVAGRALILQLLGREPTLTGRDIIWRESWHAARAEPWFGYGPGGFWQDRGEAAYQIQRVARFKVESGHQGLLDIMLDYGAVGVVLFLVFLASTVVLLARRISAGDSGPVTLVSFGLIAAVVIASLTEGNLIGPGLQVIGLCCGLLLNVPISANDVTLAAQRDNSLLSR